LPLYGVAGNRQFFLGDVALSIEEVGMELLPSAVVTDHFDAAHTEVVNGAVGGV
jgi:hypothetical protein